MKAVGLYRYRNPLNTPLRFKGIELTAREGLLLRFDHAGKTVWGECAPLPQFSVDDLQQNQQALLAWLDSDQGTIEGLPPAAQFAISSAEFMATRSQPLKALQTVPLLVGEPKRMLAQALASPQPLMKLKLARTELGQEIDLVQQLQRQRADLRLRIDANQGWTVSQACQFAEAVDLSRIDYVEEPCATLTANLAAYARSGLPLALDETTQQPDYRYQTLTGIKALVLKPSLIGSVSRLRNLIQQAHADGLSCVLSSAFESNLGLTVIAHLAQQLTPNEPAGLDTLSSLQFDLCHANPWLPDRPLLTPDQLEPLWR
ncbi:o-succinylbenzoate synthase [Ferrimonas senticii]|uniref:o-succinylbenzoate synthase n=1 Tax=Ferrimonas senticii TaxID=394566 RepID=UPI000410583E|nr:o-succinylbenzoate synthase [Ferrimonas senticii]